MLIAVLLVVAHQMRIGLSLTLMLSPFSFLYILFLTPYFFFSFSFFLFSCDALIHISFFKPLPVLSPASLAQHSSRFRPWLVLKVSVISTIPACTTTVLLFPRRRRVGGCVVYQIFLYFQKKK